MFYQIDRRGWPLVRVSFSSLPENKEVYLAFLTDMSKLYEPKVPFTMLVDTRQLGMLPFTYIVDLAKWIKFHREDARVYLEKSAILIQNPAVRSFMKALFAIAPPTSPLKMFATLPESVQYLGWLTAQAAPSTSTLA